MASFLAPISAWVRDFATKDVLRIRPLSKDVFGSPLRPDIIQRVIVWYRAGIRAGTAHTLNRAEVAGSHRKIRAQKGSGKARMGDNRMPSRVGGGIAHGPKPRDWAFDLPQDIRDYGFRSGLATKYKQNELMVISHESLHLPSHKTTELLKVLANHYHDVKKILLIDTEPLPRNLVFASRQLPHVFLATVSDPLCAYHILDNNLLILTERAVRHYEQTLVPQ